MWVCIVQGSILNLKYTDEDIFNKKYKTLNKYDAKKMSSPHFCVIITIIILPRDSWRLG